MLLFDIGANRGDATIAGLQLGYDVIALEPAPKIYFELVKNFIYEPRVKPLKYAVSDKDNDVVTFYECVEDGLSTLNIDWLTKEGMPYYGKEYRSVSVNTITIDTLVGMYGEPHLMKIDVEGAEWNVFNGMTKNYGMLTFEWTFETLTEHEAQLDYLYALGYKEVAPQYIMPHLYRPRVWYGLKADNNKFLYDWHKDTNEEWTDYGWKLGNLRPTADVGMIWVRQYFA